MKALGLPRAGAFVLGTIIGTAAFLATPVQAGAPLVKTQAPGYYRLMLGDFEITVLNDGTGPLAADELLTDTTVDNTKQAVAKAFLSLPIETSFNAFLVNTGSKLVLIDTGAGALFGPNNGKMLGNLKAAGYQPEQVDEVYITHFHVDHVGGLSANGQIVFPNAIVRADKRDPEFWLSQENLDKAPDNVKPFFKGAQVSVGPYVQAGKLQPFDGSTDLIPGIKAIATPGHTVGHTSYLVESNGQKLVVWGDLVHVGAAQFANPSITIKYDTDPKAAAEQRKQAFAQAAQEGYLVGAPHVAFPGLGHLRTEGSGYQFIPVNYSVPH